VIVTVQVNVPVAEVVAPHDVTVPPLLIVVVIVTDGLKPDPVTVVEAPLGP
jgi:hypothetical protein